jgi:hypothetical protein
MALQQWALVQDLAAPGFLRIHLILSPPPRRKLLQLLKAVDAVVCLLLEWQEYSRG